MELPLRILWDNLSPKKLNENKEGPKKICLLHLTRKLTHTRATGSWGYQNIPHFVQFQLRSSATKTSAMHTGQRTVMVSWDPDMYHRHHEESRKRHFQSIYDSHLKLQYRIKNAHSIQFCTQDHGWAVDLVTDHCFYQVIPSNEFSHWWSLKDSTSITFSQ